MKAQAIILAAGEGKRLKSPLPKALVQIKDKPIFIYTLEAIEQSSLIDSIVLVVPPDYLNEFERVLTKYHLLKVTKIVAGGNSRSVSVSCGLSVIDQDSDLVLVHDGVRPLIDLFLIDKAITLCENHQAVVVAVPIKPTIKRVDEEKMLVRETVDRQELWEIQTPQVFKREILLKAHEKGKGVKVTDDATLVEQLGEEVKICEGNYKNCKITTQEDLWFAEALLNNANKIAEV